MYSIKLFRFSSLAKVIACTSMMVSVSACQNGNMSPEQNQNAGSELLGGSTITAQIDRKLVADYPQPDARRSQVETQFYTLKQTCQEAGGLFDGKTKECFCESGGQFTTGTTTTMCAPMDFSIVSIQMFAPSGIYQDKKMLMYTDRSGLSFDDEKMLSSLMSPLYTMRAPFRLSMYGFANYLLQIDPQHPAARTESYLHNPKVTASSLYSVIQGRPFIDNGESFPMYEPNSRFVLADFNIILGLSAEELAEFESVGAVEQVGVRDWNAAEGLIAAYKSVRNAQTYVPDQVSSPYRSGCASYCVASSDLNIASDTYTATYKKVYQFGTPSARLIVLQRKNSKEVVGVISLNVAETISTITLVERHANPTLYSYRTFDRNWNALYSRDEIAEETQGADSFEQLLKVEN
jgi:hypothetical protein